MIFVKPSEWELALRKASDRTPIASILGSAEWQNVPVALRERAFFSARVENARFLNAAQSFLNDFLQQTRETLPGGATALKADGRSRFIAGMQKIAIEEGMGPIGKIADRDVRDIRSNARLGLIFDTNTRSAYHYGNWKSGLSDPILNAFPAQRFVRYPGAKIKRPLHEANEGVVRLKSDLNFWLEMNKREIGGFEVPWGPWGFNSWMDVRDVSKRDAINLGLMQEGEKPKPIPDHDFNAQLQASVSDLSPEIKTMLRRAFGARQVEFTQGIVRWRGQKGPAPKPKPKPHVTPPAPIVAPIPAKPKLPALKPAAAIRADAITQRVVEQQAAIDRVKEERVRLSREPWSVNLMRRLRELRQEQSDLEKDSIFDFHDSAQAIEKDLALPPALRKRIKLARGTIEKSKPEAGQPPDRDPSADDWNEVDKYAARAADWFEDKLPGVYARDTFVGFVRKRAYARPELHRIFIDQTAGTPTAVHEIAHVLEVQNPGWLEKAKQFRNKRCAFEPLVKLSTIYPGVTYKDDEVAYRDKWIENGGSAYAGKFYRAGDATEIVTMGIQALYEDPVRFAIRDPEYFDFIVNLMRGVEV
jgi:hypothetical protein